MPPENRGKKTKTKRVKMAKKRPKKRLKKKEGGWGGGGGHEPSKQKQKRMPGLAWYRVTSSTAPTKKSEDAPDEGKVRPPRLEGVEQIQQALSRRHHHRDAQHERADVALVIRVKNDQFLYLGRRFSKSGEGVGDLIT